jgi:glucose-1-phosphate cytidylyltransferase
MDPNHTPKIHNTHEDNNWEITFVDTGLETLKGGRIKRIEKHVESENFHLTYGDGVANLDIKKLEKFHKVRKGIGTLTAVRPPSRFGEIKLNGNKAIHFEEKPQLGTGHINGGFFVFKQDFFDHLKPSVDYDFEFGPLEKLAKNGKLYAYKHDGFWQCMDNIRERDYLNKLWDENKAKWKVWK